MASQPLSPELHARLSDIMEGRWRCDAWYENRFKPLASITGKSAFREMADSITLLRAIYKR